MSQSVTSKRLQRLSSVLRRAWTRTPRCYLAGCCMSTREEIVFCRPITQKIKTNFEILAQL